MNDELIDIFSIPIYYISFLENKKLENTLGETGFKFVNHYKAINAKKMDRDELFSNKIINANGWLDLKYGRSSHQGFPGLGSVGCTMSHYNIWNMCLSKNLSYIAVAENDLKFVKNIRDPKIQQIISKTLKKDYGVFIGKKLSVKKDIKFFGTEFYILTNNACKVLIDYCFPISVQVDSYFSMMSDINLINLVGEKVSSQFLHKSDIQKANLCLTCMIPKTIQVETIIYIIASIISVIILQCLYKKWKNKND